jgi:hypothetical protein
VFLDGDGGSTSAQPSYSGTQTLRIEPSAIPAALAAFTEAHRRVTAKVNELGGLDIRPWAQDEVSNVTAKQFTERSQGGSAESAMECLAGYQLQLENAIKALEESQARYQAMEGDNAATWGKYE